MKNYQVFRSTPFYEVTPNHLCLVLNITESKKYPTPAKINERGIIHSFDII